GEDIYSGLDGDDFILGNGGNDILDGGSGSDTIFGGEGADSVTGGSDNDTLYGDEGEDTLTSGTGNDYQQGGLGNDRYLFRRGDGQDTINDYDSVGGEVDTLWFGPDIAPSEVTASRVGTDLLLAVQGTPDTIRVSSWFSTTGVYVLDRIEFSVGTEWNEEIIRLRAECGAVDDEPPVIESLELPADGLYATDDSLLFSLRFSEAVRITESALPSVIGLTIGDESVGARYLSGSGSDILLFRYVLSTGDFDPDGILVGGEIVLNGALIRDLSGNALANTTLEAGDTSGIKVDYAPVLQDELIDREVAVSQPFSFAIPSTTFVDYDAADRLGYTVTQADGSALPAWLSFDPGTRTFSGTPQHDDAGLIVLKVTATDTAGASASDIFTISVQENDHNLGLNIAFWNGGEGIDGVTCLLTADGSGNTIIAADNGDGHYGYTELNEGNYLFRGDRAVSESDGEAVGFTDALAALKIALGIRLSRDGQAVSSYQYLAADVNRNGHVEAGDALDILGMALNREASSTEWAFVSSSTGDETMDRDLFVWPEAQISVTMDQDREIDLVGVLPGDVDGSWSS
ncbi:MAG: hypothetical protein HGA97_13100, partial [Chlorobiaceae bacterium]|nr:hypothetical protein [Chlorobiaceae bacterium]